MLQKESDLQSGNFPLIFRILPGNMAELSTDKKEKCLAPMSGIEPWIKKLQIQCDPVCYPSSHRAKDNMLGQFSEGMSQNFNYYN